MKEEKSLYADELHSSANIDYIECPNDDLLTENYPTTVTPVEISSQLDLQSSTIQQFFLAIPQIIREGKQTVAKLLALGVVAVAIIYALGSIAVPLAALQGSLIALILAVGSVAIGLICLAIGAIICQRRNG